MKKTMALLLTLLLLPVCALAGETIRIDGTIEAGQIRTIAAPHTGRVGDFGVRRGDWLSAGETLFTLSATPVYAEFDGTVTGLFAEPGDHAAAVQARYGALCYMERERLYTVDCTTSGAASENENRIIHVGECVFIRSTANNDRRGEAMVIGVDGSRYTLEVTQEKDLRLNEQVKVYRDDGYRSADCIGSGRVHRIEPEAVTAEGYVRSVHVQDGQTVRRGDLLFEIVPDALAGLQGFDGCVSMPADGVLLSIECQSGQEAAKDATLATYCERSDLRLVCAVDEEDLSYIMPGQPVTVTLDALRDEPIKGTVLSIAGASGEEDSSFDVIIALEENENVRVGMNATAEL
ncbi:MAG: HlyD family efflux transporter periplasmic adaptor subunit [Candidatus Ventricola sp.]